MKDIFTSERMPTRSSNKLVQCAICYNHIEQ